MICEPYNATLEDGFLFCVLTTQFFSKLFRSLFRQHSTPYHERPTSWSKTEARPVNNMRLMREGGVVNSSSSIRLADSPR